ncbi:hypothetical protein P7C71_g3070, partial [Lecanoromycetidae sp. Uapishka_2]
MYDNSFIIDRYKKGLLGGLGNLVSRVTKGKGWDVRRATNAYMQSSAPWDLDKPEDEEQLDKVIFSCAESIRICGILLQPYMPAKMRRLLDMLGVAADARLYANTMLGSDQDFGEATSSPEKDTHDVLFPPLTSHF